MKIITDYVILSVIQRILWYLLHKYQYMIKIELEAAFCLNWVDIFILSHFVSCHELDFNFP